MFGGTFPPRFFILSRAKIANNRKFDSKTINKKNITRLKSNIRMPHRQYSVRNKLFRVEDPAKTSCTLRNTADVETHTP